MQNKIKGTTYQYIVNDIKNKIIEKTYHIGDKLPSMSQLCDEYNTSSTTIKKSLDILKNNGYIISKHRIGYFISEAQMDLFRVKFNIYDNLKEPITDIEFLSSTLLEDKKSFLEMHKIKNKNVNVNKIECLYMHKALPIAFEIFYIANCAKIPLEKVDLKNYLSEFDIILYSQQIHHQLKISLLQSKEIATQLMESDDCLFFKAARLFRQMNSQFVACSEAYIPANVIDLKSIDFTSHQN